MRRLGDCAPALDAAEPKLVACAIETRRDRRPIHPSLSSADAGSAWAAPVLEAVSDARARILDDACRLRAVMPG